MPSGASTVSICGNHMTGNGGGSSTAAQILFSGVNDAIAFCGNTYTPENQNGDVTFKPSYVYDADFDTVLTNSALYENPGPQALGVYTTAASIRIPQLKVPHYASNHLSGLTMQNNGSPSAVVDILQGEANDSTNSVVILNSGTCPVDLGTTGAGGLDISTPAVGTTYFYYLISAADGSHPSCITSKTSPPSFLNTGSTYAKTLNGYLSTDGLTVYALDSLAGVLPDDVVTLAVGSTLYTRSVFKTSTITFAAPGTQTGVLGGTFPACTITGITSGTTGMLPFMAISAGTRLSNSATIASVTSGSITYNNTGATSCPNTGTTAVDFIVSGGRVLTLNGTPISVGSPTPVSPTVYTGLYRMVGALYTKPGVANIIPFHQDGDTFYLNTPVSDIPAASGTCTGNIGMSAQSCQLSVPCGLNAATCGSTPISVEAIGRIASTGTSSNRVIVSSLDQGDQAPAGFPTVPGNTSTSSASQDAYPFRLYTSVAPSVTVGAIRARSTASVPVNEMTDGWVFHRAQ